MEETRMSDSVLVENADVLADSGFHRLAEYFGLKKEEKYTRKEDLKFLMDWARMDPSVKDELDLLWKVRTAERQYQTENHGENRAATLKRYLYLNGEKDKLEKEMTLLREQGGNDAKPVRDSQRPDSGI
jgi:hypothetical protein